MKRTPHTTKHGKEMRFVGWELVEAWLAKKPRLHEHKGTQRHHSKKLVVQLKRNHAS